MFDKTPDPVAWRWGIPGLRGYTHWRYSLNKTKDDAEPLYRVLPRLKHLPDEKVYTLIELHFKSREDFTVERLRYFAESIQYYMEKINRG